MKIRVSNLRRLSMAVCFAALPALSALAADSGAQARVEADNSKVNKRDANAGEVTADSQNSEKADVEIIRKIRHSLTSDSALSTYAQNIKIVSEKGRVVLKGPVRSDQERAKVEQMAITVAGKANVTNELEVTR